jgi:catechol 2,3-dioxygenase-like lactoylglutathione lyase family enzyme
MIDHMGFKTSKIAAARAFYDAAFAAMGGGMRMEVPKEYTGGAMVMGYGRERPVFWLTEAEGSNGPLHVAFAARSRAEVDAFYQAAMAAGGRDNGGPGLRPEYTPTYYAAFVLDPDGNNVEAVCHLPD